MQNQEQSPVLTGKKEKQEAGSMDEFTDKPMCKMLFFKSFYLFPSLFPSSFSNTIVGLHNLFIHLNMFIECYLLTVSTLLDFFEW